MIKTYLIGFGLTALISIPTIFVGSLAIRYVMTSLWNETPKEMMLIQSQTNDLFNNIFLFFINNWFYILVIIALFAIVFILYFILAEIHFNRNKKT